MCMQNSEVAGILFATRRRLMVEKPNYKGLFLHGRQISRKFITCQSTVLQGFHWIVIGWFFKNFHLTLHWWNPYETKNATEKSFITVDVWSVLDFPTSDVDQFLRIFFTLTVNSLGNFFTSIILVSPNTFIIFDFKFIDDSNCAKAFLKEIKCVFRIIYISKFHDCWTYWSINQ